MRLLEMTTDYASLGRGEVAHEHFMKPRAVKPESGEP
jgi:hypothetical protein